MNKPLPQEGWPNFGAVHSRKWRGWWKVGTLLFTVGSAYAMVFHVKFEQENHVFVPLRRWHARLVDDLLGEKREPQEKKKTD
jgi:hypothetical protein